MCGIVGVASSRSMADANLVSYLRDELTHRGPDDAGIWMSDDHSVALGHRRLSVIDLSPKGHQPMSDRTGKLWITYNGEIYNYKQVRQELESLHYVFSSESDTEVILNAFQAWGQQCLTHLTGAFAFALFDNTTHKLFLARDRAGEKPLYYAHGSQKLIFASEIKALLADPDFPRRLDVAALNTYLTLGYVTGEQCILSGIKKLKPGHVAVYDVRTDQLDIQRYWHLPAPPSDPDPQVEELVTSLQELLYDAVQKQLVADVPVGILLSGGMDSSLITAIASKVSSKPVNTFTITFPGYGKVDESKYARLIATHFHTNHKELVAEAETVELLPILARQYDEPIADTSIVPTYLVTKLIRQYATVALGGDGGDELFGGYPYYSWLYYLRQARNVLPAWARVWGSKAVENTLPVGFPGRNHLIGLRGDFSDSISHINMLFDEPFRRDLVEPCLSESGAIDDAPERYRASLCTPEYSWLRQATETDFRTTMADAFLVKVDRASMLNSLEVRAPFLDHRLIEFAFGQVPDRLKVKGRKRKILLRHLAKRVLPGAFDPNRKQGFVIPMDLWFKDKWGAFIRSLLLSSDQRLFNRSVIQRLIEGQLKGLNNTRRLFALTMFELWRREYRITV